MLVRRLADAPVEEYHRLRNHILMDAGEMGSRNMSVIWIDVPTGVEQELHSHEEAEQIYIVVRGSGRMTVAGDTQEIAPGDLILVPPATDHSIANDGDAALSCASVQSPAVSAEEFFGRQTAPVAGELEEDGEY